MVFNRVILLILDSVGVGELPDAHQYGDKGANTLGNIAEFCNGLHLPNMQQLGIGNIIPIKGTPPIDNPIGFYGKMEEASVGKDTTTGHWEIAGLRIVEPFNTYPDGFPTEVIESFSNEISRGILANKPASGTAIIEEYGEEHIKTGRPIIYTSADSVFQVAAHEEVIPLEELYRICEIARKLLHGKYAVARVIARPFIGEPGKFQRTSNRKDYSVSPAEPTILNHLKNAGYDVISIGKIYDIFNGEGITASYKSKNNLQGLQLLEQEMGKKGKGLLFANLVDFDMLYGHRNDPAGYAKALVDTDNYIPRILQTIKEDDLLIITADHGCDPTSEGTDHTREYVPLLVFHKGTQIGNSLGIRKTFADIAATIADNFEINGLKNGTSFLSEIR